MALTLTLAEDEQNKEPQGTIVKEFDTVEEAVEWTQGYRMPESEEPATSARGIYERR